MDPANKSHAIESLPWLGICEPFSSLSHLLGAVVFSVLATQLIRKSRGDSLRLCSIIAFSASGMVQLLISSIYHMLWPGPARDLMLRADVATVFLLIAGSMTPAHAILFTGLQRWGALALIWSIAIGGIVWRTLYCDLTPGPLGIAFFLLCGWSCSVTAHVLHRRFGWLFIQPAVLSGLAYTIGAIGLVLHWPHPIPGVIGPHDLWHIAVLAGLILHWRFVSQFAAGPPAASIPITATREAEPVASLERQ